MIFTVWYQQIVDQVVLEVVILAVTQVVKVLVQEVVADVPEVAEVVVLELVARDAHLDV